MADLPLPFSPAMIEANLAGRKRLTRRVLRKQPPEGFEPDGCCSANMGGRDLWWDYWRAGIATTHRIKLPYGIGDRLWIREAWSAPHRYTGIPPREIPPGEAVWYWADGDPTEGDWTKPKPAMFMPRWASRMTAVVERIRVERLQSITEEDALAEGITQCGRFFGLPNAEWDFASSVSAVDAYAILWDALNADRGLGWSRNPWILVVSYRLERLNVGELGGA